AHCRLKLTCFDIFSKLEQNLFGSLEIFGVGTPSVFKHSEKMILFKMDDITLTNQFSGCLEIFAKFNSIKAENFKYIKTQFYRKVIKSHTFDASDVSSEHHKYQTVSIPKSYCNTPRFQQKGIIFIWPQKRKFFRYKELIYVAWFTSHLLYWLYIVNILPSGGVLPLEQPPWNFEILLRKPENRDYIIEPDWDLI
ncbi:unnamed protein product, partial [Phyllotreta striolata]